MLKMKKFPYRTYRLCARIFAIPCTKNLERPKVCYRNILWWLFRTDFPRTCVRPLCTTDPGISLFSCDLGIMLWLHETYGWSRAHRTWEAVRAYDPQEFRIHTFTGFSLCFKYRISITNTCPLCFHKGYVHVDVIWTRTDAMQVLEHTLKLRNYPCWTCTDFETP